MKSLARWTLLAGAIAVGLSLVGAPSRVEAQDRLPWQQRNEGYGQPLPPPGYDDRAPPRQDAYRPSDPYSQGDRYRADSYGAPPRQGDVYSPRDSYGSGGGYAQPRESDVYRPERGAANDAYRPPSAPGGYVDNYRRGRGYVSDQPRPDDRGGGYGQPYAPAPGADYPDDRYGPGEPPPPPNRDPRGPRHERADSTYSQNEIMDAGHRFFGSISQGLANVIEHAFKQAGRPNGYILGEDAGGAFVAGLRYGEGMLYTKDAGNHRVYWQGPSIGYDFGAEGSKTMVLVYNLRDPAEIYNRFGGVQGSAYVVGGVGIQFQKNEDVVLAPIRAGLGLRLGANVGYLKYTRTPTWNPF